MTTKQEKFQDAKKKATYWDVVKAFNALNKILGSEYYSSSINLTTAKGEKVPGFVYTGYAAGVGLGRILDALNVKYVTFMKGGSGVEEQSEIHVVDKESQKRILDIFEKVGDLKSNVQSELDMKIVNHNHPWLQQVR